MKKSAAVPEKAIAASLWRTIKMVLWSFLGIRKSSEWQEDSAQANPFHVILVGFAGVILLIIGLVLLVNWVVPG